MAGGIDPIVLLSELKLIRDSADLEAELTSHAPGWFISIYRRLRRSAAEAIANLSAVDAIDRPQDYRALQVRIQVFDAFVQEVKALISDGISADQNMTDAERQEVTDVLLEQGVDGQAIANDLGLIDEPPGTGTA